jgi:hypothetical protein
MPFMKLSRYLEVLRTPGVARVALFATMGRLPFAIVPLSIVLLMREEGYPYGQIGAVVGAGALAVGLTAGFVGRLVDRIGRRRVILVTGAITTRRARRPPRLVRWRSPRRQRRRSRRRGTVRPLA